MTEDSLRQICLQEIPLSFYKGLAEGSDSVYKEADAMAFRTPSWSKSQGNYIAPHLRLILFESLLETTAKAAGLVAVPTENVSKNYKYTLVRANRLVLTASSVEGRNELPRESVFRNQLCEANAFLNSPYIPNLYEASHPTSLYARQEIYGIILHGKSYVKTDNDEWITDAGRFSFLRLAFMDEAMEKFIANFDVYELCTQAMSLKDQRDVQDRATPRLKGQDDQNDRKDVSK